VLKIDEAKSISRANNIAIVLPLKSSLNMNDKQKNIREEYTIAKNINGANWRPLWAPKNQSDKITPTKVVRPSTMANKENPPKNFPDMYSTRLMGLESNMSAVPCSYSSDIEPPPTMMAIN
jgi:hypothetical protein